MATIAAKAARRARVNERLRNLSDHIAQEFGVDVPPITRTTRDPELDQIIELERIADIFDGILAGSGDVIDAESIDVMHISRPYRASEFLEDFDNLEDLKQIAVIAGVDAELVEDLDDPGLIAEAIGERINADDFEYAEFGVTDEGKIINFAELDEDEVNPDDPEGGQAGDEELITDGSSDEEPAYDFAAMKRADLDAVAPKFGIDPKEHSKVDDLRAALIAASESEGEG